jgi:hypothetical protein
MLELKKNRDMKNLPEKIYLCFGDSVEIEHWKQYQDDSKAYIEEMECVPQEPDFKEFYDVSWCEDRIDETDIQYVLNRWIPFEERQPEPGQLVAFLSEKISKPWAGVYYSNTEEFYASNSTYMNASHWLPLPEPPKY